MSSTDADLPALFVAGILSLEDIVEKEKEGYYTSAYDRDHSGVIYQTGPEIFQHAGRATYAHQKAKVGINNNRSNFINVVYLLHTENPVNSD